MSCLLGDKTLNFVLNISVDQNFFFMEYNRNLHKNYQFSHLRSNLREKLKQSFEFI